MELLAAMVALASGIRVGLDHDQYKTPLIMEQCLALYRIAQEHLNNVIKHAEATEVEMNLWQDEEQTFLVIKDNGKGFNRTIKKWNRAQQYYKVV
ncbi:MAG: hypothetical protein C4308_03840 [Chitinophagaceae bacterium]